MSVLIYQAAPAYGLRSSSPFCTKLEAYLRLSEIAYESRVGDPRRAPKGKLPIASIDGETVCDSSEIIERCKVRFGDPLDEDLDEGARATGHLIKRMCEEHLYWCAVALRWANDEVWNTSFRAVLASMLPAPARPFLPQLIRRKVRGYLHAHGLGRHSDDEIVQACAADLDALASLLGKRSFLLADEPTSYDCSAYAMLEHIRKTPGDQPMNVALRERTSLVAYCERMNERIDWPASADAAVA